MRGNEGVGNGWGDRESYVNICSIIIKKITLLFLKDGWGNKEEEEEIRDKEKGHGGKGRGNVEKKYQIIKKKKIIKLK